eukprot:CAMPEP_0201578994 /NCGR_PEP_ID=MMETSP0190_2-20130828/26187_1 /ASSEMBLY_ACC=CAM_ASM_000263 /TAXON_ID=37353 /ORGANISM="Rosalina sp." /LENGTH=86 /DNA_ID=CAMNT_0048012795 /DNA_START=60 /DNA_END=317 /DNA_ORIENTATION=+
MNKLQEEDEEIDREEEKKYQSQLQFAMMSSERNIGGFQSTPGTPFQARMSSNSGGLSGMGVSGKQGDGTFNFGASGGTYANMQNTP